MEDGAIEQFKRAERTYIAIKWGLIVFFPLLVYYYDKRKRK